MTRLYRMQNTLAELHRQWIRIGGEALDGAAQDGLAGPVEDTAQTRLSDEPVVRGIAVALVGIEQIGVIAGKQAVEDVEVVQRAVRGTKPAPVEPELLSRGVGGNRLPCCGIRQCPSANA